MALLVLAGGGGCRPDRAVVGGGIRQVKAEVGGNNLKLLVPVYEIQLVKDLTRDTEGYWQLQFVEFTPNTAMVAGGEVKGQAQSLGLGMRWYPFTDSKVGRAIGFGAEGEVFRVAYTIEGVFAHAMKYEISDRLWGYGLTPSVVGELALDKKNRWLLTWRVGYSFIGDCDSEFNLDGGLSVGLAMQVAIGK